MKADNREAWRVLREILQRKKNSICHQPENNTDGKHIFNLPKDIANGFNEYFADIGPSLSNEILVGRANIHDYMQAMMKDSIFSMGIT